MNWSKHLCFVSSMPLKSKEGFRIENILTNSHSVEKILIFGLPLRLQTKKFCLVQDSNPRSLALRPRHQDDRKPALTNNPCVSEKLVTKFAKIEEFGRTILAS